VAAWSPRRCRRACPLDITVERPEEFAPDLDPALLELVQATAEMVLADADDPMVSSS
jgi:hypothetical protein